MIMYHLLAPPQIRPIQGDETRRVAGMRRGTAPRERPTEGGSNARLLSAAARYQMDRRFGPVVLIGYNLPGARQAGIAWAQRSAA